MEHPLSLSLPERVIGVKLTYGPVGDAPMSIKPLPPPCCGHIVNSKKFPEITLGAKGLRHYEAIHIMVTMSVTSCNLDVV